MLDVKVIRSDEIIPSKEAFLHIWTVYKHPSDYPPGTWVARRSEAHANQIVLLTGDVRVAQSLEDLRAQLPQGLTHLARMAEEDPVIQEHWI